MEEGALICSPQVTNGATRFRFCLFVLRDAHRGRRILAIDLPRHVRCAGPVRALPPTGVPQRRNPERNRNLPRCCRVRASGKRRLGAEGKA